MTVPEVDANGALGETSAASNRPKRVRTGCLTCRERHLKCDEGLPHCQNCKKSNRICKRGLRLNFIDTNVREPPVIPTPTEWRVSIVDESREIASEYMGGLARYGVHEPEVEQPHVQQHQQQLSIQNQHIDPSIQFDYPNTAPTAPAMSYQELPPIQGILPDSGYSDDPSQQTQMKFEPAQDHYQNNMNAPNESPFSVQNQVSDQSHAAYGQHPEELNSATERREFLTSQDEVLFMQGSTR